MTDKNNLRNKILAVRNTLDLEHRLGKGRTICEKLLASDIYKNARVIMCYMDFRNEVPTSVFSQACINDCKTLCFPVCVDDKTMFAAEADKLPKRNRFDIFGIAVPETGKYNVIEPDAIDLVVIPGTVFSKQGYRIGYGKGFYDRYLLGIREDCFKVGFGYDFQIVDHIEPDIHDIPVDILISEKSTYYNEHCTVGL